MNIAIIGTGKTGGTFLQNPSFINKNEHQIFPFNSKNPVTVEKLQAQKIDVAIIFVPGATVQPLVDLLSTTSLPCVWGTTGYEFASSLNQKLKQQNSTWIHAHNFSLGMHVVRHLLSRLKNDLNIFQPPASLSLSETHHTHKKDAPSGTALSWQKWLGRDHLPIESIREGDVIGIHQLTVSTPQEEITLRHEAKDRALFAQGAYLAAQLLFQKKLSPGLHHFDQVTDLIFEQKIKSSH